MIFDILVFSEMLCNAVDVIDDITSNDIQTNMAKSVIMLAIV